MPRSSDKHKLASNDAVYKFIKEEQKKCMKCEFKDICRVKHYRFTKE